MPYNYIEKEDGSTNIEYVGTSKAGRPQKRFIVGTIRNRQFKRVVPTGVASKDLFWLSYTQTLAGFKALKDNRIGPDVVLSKKKQAAANSRRGYGNMYSYEVD